MSGAGLSRRQLAVGLGVAPVLAACTAKVENGAEASGPALACTLILVRHTEKVGDGSADPALTDAGQARAEEFARTFEHAGVTALLHSGLIRTRDTLAPLAARTGVTSDAIAPASRSGVQPLIPTLPAAPSARVSWNQRLGM